MVPKLCQKVPKWSQNGSKLVLQLSQNSPKIFQVIDLDVINLNSEFEPCSSLNSWDKLLVQFLATKELLVSLANDPIMMGRLIGLFRHLEHQNPSTISDSIGRARIVQQFQSWIGGVGSEEESEEYSCLRTSYNISILVVGKSNMGKLIYI